jgi:hypothetical protein
MALADLMRLSLRERRTRGLVQRRVAGYAPVPRHAGAGEMTIVVDSIARLQERSA